MICSTGCAKSGGSGIGVFLGAFGGHGGQSGLFPVLRRLGNFHHGALALLVAGAGGVQQRSGVGQALARIDGAGA
ncbi:hypothetical protein G6F59_018790 [Rhizopus arrhizus]|nr:hypothetical protein G6F59_018790 [Rhizopus arrhizus]